MMLEDKTIAVLVEDRYQDMEVWYPYYRLKEAGAEVFFVGGELGKIYESKHGYPVKAERGIEEVSADDFDAVVIPGGYAPDMMRRNLQMVAFVREMGEGGKIVAAICHAGWMLASADLIRGKKITSFFAIKDDVVNAGAEYVDKEVVRDGNIITSRTPDDLPAFCRTIIEALSE